MTPLLVVSLCGLLATAVDSSNIILSGRVVDQYGKPLDIIRIKVEASDKVLLEMTLDLQPGGALSIGLGAVGQGTLRCHISAAGFETAQITALVQGEQALLGIVKLKRYLDLGPIEVLRVADGSAVYLDFWITSQTPRPLIIKQVILSSEEARQGPCFDSTPRISFNFRNIEVEGNSKSKNDYRKLRVSLLVHPERKNDLERTFRVEGSFHRDPCGPSVIKLIAPYSFSLETGNQNQPIKIRITVPFQFKLNRVGIIRPNWEQASIHITLNNGETISAKAG